MDDLVQAQERLGRAIGRARVGEDRELANKVRELGERLANLLYGQLRMCRLHAPDNRAFDQPVLDLATTIEQLGDLLGAVHLVTVEDQVYVNDVRIRGSERASGLKELGGDLARHNAGGLSFHEPLDGPRIRSLLRCLSAAPPETQPRTALVAALQDAGLSSVEVHGRYRFRMAKEAPKAAAEPVEALPSPAAPDTAGSPEPERPAAPAPPPRAPAGPAVPCGLGGRAVAAVDEAFQNLAAGRVPNPLPLRRIVTELLQRDLAEEDLWAAREGPALAVHAWRVTLLALAVGRSAGLNEGALQDLGVAALYHDSGYARDGAGLADHPTGGAALMLRQKGFSEAKTRRVLALAQHHEDAGSPARPALFGRILRLVEDYDNGVHRGGRSPAHVLTGLCSAARTRYDPVLLHLLVNAVGRYPPGTFLLLPDGRVARVVAPPSSPERHETPPARLFAAPGRASVDPEPVDLAGLAVKVVVPAARPTPVASGQPGPQATTTGSTG